MYHIIIADDEPVTRDSIKDNLQIMLPDAVLHTACNGAEAVNLSSSNPVDIAFLDIRMPVMSGLQAAKEIQKQHAQCQIVFLTAYSDFAYTQEALRLGAIDYVLKPFSWTSLSMTVQKAINRIAFQVSEKKENQRIHRQAQKLEQWFGDQLVLNVMNGYLSANRIETQLRKIGLSFMSGAFAVLQCTKGMSVDRIRGMVRGCEWDPSVRLFMYEYDDCLYILAVDSITTYCANLLSQQFHKLIDKVQRLMHKQIFCVISSTFENLELAPQACSHCCTMLRSCHADCPIVVEPDDQITWKSNERATAVEQLLIQLHEKNSQQALECLKSDFEHYRVQQLSLHALKEKMFFYFEEVKQRLSLPIKTQWYLDFPSRTQLFACENIDALLMVCTQLLERLLQEICGFQDTHGIQVKREIEDYILNNYQQDIMLPQIAKDMEYSETYFSRLFKKCFKKNFIAYLTEIRLNEAKKLLHNSDISIKEVAKRVGYRECGYFSKVFRKTFGKTPSEYRSSLNESSFCKGLVDEQ